jgi:hypothetical protein
MRLWHFGEHLVVMKKNKLFSPVDQHLNNKIRYKNSIKNLREIMDLRLVFVWGSINE